MSKFGIAAALAAATEVKPALCKKLLETLAEVATKEVKSAGKFTIPGLCMLKTRKKPATKAGKREVFGKVMKVKAKPATTVVFRLPGPGSGRRFSPGLPPPLQPSMPYGLYLPAPFFLEDCSSEFSSCSCSGAQMTTAQR